MLGRDTSRKIEGVLTLGALVLLIPALFLVYRAKMREVPPADAVLVNEASAKQWAQAFGLESSQAERIVAYRAAHGGFTSSEQVYDALDPQTPRPPLKRLLMRLPGEVAWRFWSGATLFLLATFLLPAWLRGRRVNVGGDPFLLPLSLLLSGLGVIVLFSVKDPLRDRDVHEHHLWGILLGLAVLVVTTRLLPAARLRIKSYQYLWVFASAALALALFLFGGGPEGVKLTLLGFQPVELIKLMLVFFLASYLADRAALLADTSPRGWSNANPKPPAPGPRILRMQDIGPVVVLYGFALMMFAVVRDLGPGALLFATFVTTLYLTTGRGLFVAVGILLLLGGAFLGYHRHLGVFATRVDMWLNPFQNAYPNGMQAGQAYWGMATGGVEGSGLGLGMPGLIPRAGSDMAFASWAEETGLLGAWLVLTVYVALVWRGLRLALRASNDFDRALAFGLTALLGWQAFFILGGVTGVVPLAGLSLPFLSYGNSALVANFALIGLLRGISVPPLGGVGRPESRREVVSAARRCAALYAVGLLGVVGLWRLGQIQLLRADETAVRPIVTPDADKVVREHSNPRLLAIEREIARGSIYDRNGRILATSRPDEIAKWFRDPEEAKRAMEARLRCYPFGAATAHLVGYLDPAVGGPSGLEKGYNTELRGFPRYADLLADYRHRHLPGYRPRRGRDLFLTLDAALQREAQNQLWRTAGQLKDKKTGKPKDRAAFVLLQPKTGDVLVAATIPSFDPNALTPEQMRYFQTAPEEKATHRLVNRALQGVYPPGSTMKVATAACALDALPNAAEFAVECNRVSKDIRWQAGGVTYMRRNVRDDAGDPNFGTLTLSPAFRVSSNIYFANLAAELGAKTFRETLVEKMGFRYVPKQKEFDADLPDIGYGQGRMLASPLEMARLAGAVANDGVMMQARYVTSLSDPADRKNKQVFTPTALSQAMTAPTARTLQGLMRSVVTGGTARGVFGEVGVPIAGKTGTAQNEQNDHEPHSWFIGFAPYSEEVASLRPNRLAFACVVENGGYGKRVAAVICRDILRKIYSR